MTDERHYDADVIIIGGGPAGATLGSFLGRGGYTALIIEKDIHPRDHVGESLVPSTNLVFDKIGFLDKMNDAGFIKKRGTAWNGPRSKTWKFVEIPLFEVPIENAPQPWTYQVERDAMDTLLTQATFTADSAVTAGPIAGPGNQILVGTQNGTLYSLSKNLGVRWQKSIGGAIKGMPAYSADALYVVTNDRLKAYNPNTGAQLWSHLLSNGSVAGSVAVGYGREVFAQTQNGTVAAVGEGWTYAPFAVAADPVLISRRAGLPPACPVCSAASGAPVTPGNVAGFKIQRSDDGGDWIDIATVPSTTLIYSDTSVLDNTNYAYRVQTLDAGGNDSDFTGTAGSQPSLPALAQAPTLISVTALSVEALRLAWSSPADDVVVHYQIERGLSAGGPFTLVAQALGGAGGSDDAGLAPASTYYYRIQALNDSGASPYSNVLSGTTRALTLPTPQNVGAKLLSNGQIQVSWTAGPVGVGTLVEVIEDGVQDYQLLGTTDNAGPFAHYPNEPSGFSYRVKFVQGNAESAYGYTALGVDTRIVSVYLPLIVK